VGDRQLRALERERDVEPLDERALTGKAEVRRVERDPAAPPRPAEREVRVGRREARDAGAERPEVDPGRREASLGGAPRRVGDRAQHQGAAAGGGERPLDRGARRAERAGETGVEPERAGEVDAVRGVRDERGEERAELPVRGRRVGDGDEELARLDAARGEAFERGGADAPSRPPLAGRGGEERSVEVERRGPVGLEAARRLRELHRASRERRLRVDRERERVAGPVADRGDGVQRGPREPPALARRRAGEPLEEPVGELDGPEAPGTLAPCDREAALRLHAPSLAEVGVRGLEEERLFRVPRPRREAGERDVRAREVAPFQLEVRGRGRAAPVRLRDEAETAGRPELRRDPRRLDGRFGPQGDRRVGREAGAPGGGEGEALAREAKRFHVDPPGGGRRERGVARRREAERAGALDDDGRELAAQAERPAAEVAGDPGPRRAGREDEPAERGRERARDDGRDLDPEVVDVGRGEERQFRRRRSLRLGERRAEVEAEPLDRQLPEVDAAPDRLPDDELGLDRLRRQERALAGERRTDAAEADPPAERVEGDLPDRQEEPRRVLGPPEPGREEPDLDGGDVEEDEERRGDGDEEGGDPRDDAPRAGPGVFRAAGHAPILGARAVRGPADDDAARPALESAGSSEEDECPTGPERVGFERSSARRSRSWPSCRGPPPRPPRRGSTRSSPGAS